MQSGNFDDQQARGSRYQLASRRSFLVGLALSLLIHAIGLWALIERAALPLKPPTATEQGRLTISLAPPAAPTPPAVSTPAPTQRKTPPPAVNKPQKKPAPPAAKKQRPRKPPPAIDRAPPRPSPNPIASATRPDNEPPQTAPADDMYTQLQAARKRRAEAQAQAGIPEPEPAPSPKERANDDNSIALANVASSLNRARDTDKTDAGGVFQVRRVGYGHAEFLFRGWSTRSRRNTTRLVTVDQGNEIDIQTAIVKKMIDIIREEKTDTFIWDSHRLGKQITLSAKPQDGAALQRFLLQEFFPDYLPPAAARK